MPHAKEPGRLRLGYMPTRSRGLCVHLLGHLPLVALRGRAVGHFGWGIRKSDLLRDQGLGRGGIGRRRQWW